MSLYKTKVTFKSSIVIIESPYIIRNGTDDWETSARGFRLNRLNIPTYLTYNIKSSAIVYDIDPIRRKDSTCINVPIIGELKCSSSKTISIVSLEELSQYNKCWKKNSINKYIIIKDFIGTVSVDKCNKSYIFGFGNKFFMIEVED